MSGELKCKIDTLQPEVVLTIIESSADTTTCIGVGAQITTDQVCEYVASAGLDMTNVRGISMNGDVILQWSCCMPKVSHTSCSRPVCTVWYTDLRTSAC